MKLALVVAGACIVCRVSPQQHERCAVCEASNQVVRLCPFCYEWHKENNIEWNDKKLETVGRRRRHLVDDEGDASSETAPMRDAQAPTRPRGRPRSTAIDDAVIPRLRRGNRLERVTVERIDLEGRRRGTYQRWQLPSRREIARRVGCSHASVDRRYHDYARAESHHSRARSARRLTE